MDMMATFLEYLWLPFHIFINPNERFYFVSFLGATAMALWFLRGPNLMSNLKKTIFNTEFWINPSARLDYKFFVINPMIINIVWVPSLVGSQATIIFLVDGFMDNAIGPIDTIHFPRWLIITLFTIAVFLSLDFAKYVMHRAMHQYKLLWELHKIHHTASSLNFFTVHRFHPLELLLVKLRNLIVLGTVTGLFTFLFKDRIDIWDVLGVNIIGFLFNSFGSILRHSNIAVSYPKWLERILISPRQHHLHHSRHPDHYHCNFGVVFALWDNLFATIAFSPPDHELIEFGVIEDQQLFKEHRLLVNLVQPILRISRYLLRVRSS